jgi:hypothetical protein
MKRRFLNGFSHFPSPAFRGMCTLSEENRLAERRLQSRTYLWPVGRGVAPIMGLRIRLRCFL